MIYTPETASTIVTATPTDNNSLSKTSAAFAALKKAKLLCNEATPEQIEDARIWWNNHPLSEYIGVDAMFNIVNSDAFNNWTINGISLFVGASYIAMYHEAWHGFSQIFLTIDQKRDLYYEARKLSGSFTTIGGKKTTFAEASDFELEEHMAESFRKYVLSEGTEVLDKTPNRRSIFLRIWNFLNSLYSKRSFQEMVMEEGGIRAVKEIYEKLYIGQINDYNPCLYHVRFGRCS